MRTTTRSVARSTLVAIMTAFAALILGVTQTLTSAVTAAIGLSAVQALIVPGTGTPNPANDYMNNARDYYLVPSDNCVGGCTNVAVPYFATFWPIPLPGWGGLQGEKWNVSVADGVSSLNGKYIGALTTTPGDNIVIFGYSQGATVATNFKREHRNDPWAVKAKTNYFFIGDPQRPDGGFFERFAILGNVPILDAQFGDPAPTDTCTDAAGNPRVCATDFALMYDGVVDFPEWILNPLALVNAVAGFQYVHGTYLAPNGDDPVTETPYGYSVQEVKDAVAAAEAPGGCTPTNYCQEHGDTRYITLPAKVLPIFQLPLDLADATGTSALVIPIVDLLQPATQTLIETAYTRDDYGVPSPATLLPRFNPFQVAQDLASDIPEGINNALTPGLQPLPPLPGTGPDAATTLRQTDDSTNILTAEKPKLFDGKLLTRPSLFAKPNAGITATGAMGADPDRPLRAALGNVHPVRDVVKAVSGAVNKTLGKEDSTADPAE
jgi:hypothetical protein